LLLLKKINAYSNYAVMQSEKFCLPSNDQQ
jgi:hypothetical protein